MCLDFARAAAHLSAGSGKRVRTMDIVIIGAGVVGVTTGLALVREGHSVTILDREGVAAGASRGNAGAFAFPAVVPIAAPGAMRKAPRWLFDPLGPLSIPPRYAHKIAPWLARFWRASWRDRFEPTVAAQGAMMEHCSRSLEALVQRHALEPLLRREGHLDLYDDEKSFRDALKLWDIAAQHGVDFERVESAAALAEHQAGLSSKFEFGVYTPQWLNVTDPRVWVETLADLFQSAGGKIDITNVRGLTRTTTGVEIETEAGLIAPDRIVVAAGAFSHKLAIQLGHKIPLETERGYNTTLPAGAFDLSTQLTFVDHGFVVGKSGDGVRVGGAVELAGLDLPSNMDRADAMLTKAKQFLPNLRTEGGTQWMGFRPSTPDCKPVISLAPNEPEVIYAFGHGHLGLTQSVGTGELVADLVAGRKPSIDITPFRSDRFQSLL